MYPLKITVSGCKDGDLSGLRRAIAQQPATLFKEFADIDSFLDDIASFTDSRSLHVVRVDSPQALLGLKRMSRLIAGQPIVALMNADSDSTAIISTLRAGACQVVFLPIRGEDWKAALATVLIQFGYQASESKVIAVSGVTEGSGATSLAVNLSYEIAATHQRQTILAELSFRMGRLASYLEIQPSLTLTDCLTQGPQPDAAVVEQALTPVADNLRVLTGPHQSIGTSTPSPDAVLQLIDLLRQLAQVVVLDMTYAFDDTYFQVLAAADTVVLIGEPNVPSLHALKLVKETVEKQDARHKPLCLINRFKEGDPVFTRDKMETVVGRPVLTVPSDSRAFRAATNNGRWLREQSPHSQVVAALERLASQILGVAPPVRASWGAWFKRLWGGGQPEQPSTPLHPQASKAPS